MLGEESLRAFHVTCTLIERESDREFSRRPNDAQLSRVEVCARACVRSSAGDEEGALSYRHWRHGS